MSLENLKHLGTELQNPRTNDIDFLSSLQLLTLINEEDASVIGSVRKVLPVVQQVVDHLVPLIKQGGRVFYLGAGTSGRLAVLDASEIPPTFSMPSDKFVGLIAGGDQALRQAKEFSEDDLNGAKNDLLPYNLDPALDTVVGIASSGRTPYVIGALKYGKEIGCRTVGIACVENSALEVYADYMISCATGPEVVTGSTRLKAGTATKLILNMISTATMIRVGKTYGNLMVDLMPTNLKLRDRTRRILRAVCGNEFYVIQNGQVSKSTQFIEEDSNGDSLIDNTLQECGGSLKLAIIIAKTGISVEEAKAILNENGNVLRRALYSASLNSDDEMALKNSSSSGLPTPVLLSSASLDPLEDWNLAVDIINGHINISLYKKNELKFNSCSEDNDLEKNLANILQLTCSYIDPLFEKSRGLLLESIKVGVDDESRVNTVLKTFKDFNVPESQIQVVIGTPGYCDIIKSITAN